MLAKPPHVFCLWPEWCQYQCLNEEFGILFKTSYKIINKMKTEYNIALINTSILDILLVMFLCLAEA